MPVQWKPTTDTEAKPDPWENNRHSRASHLRLGALATGAAVSNPTGTADNATIVWG